MQTSIQSMGMLPTQSMSLAGTNQLSTENSPAFAQLLQSIALNGESIQSLEGMDEELLEMLAGLLATMELILPQLQLSGDPEQGELAQWGSELQGELQQALARFPQNSVDIQSLELLKELQVWTERLTQLVNEEEPVALPESSKLIGEEIKNSSTMTVNAQGMVEDEPKLGRLTKQLQALIPLISRETIKVVARANDGQVAKSSLPNHQLLFQDSIKVNSTIPTQQSFVGEVGTANSLIPGGIQQAFTVAAKESMLAVSVQTVEKGNQQSNLATAQLLDSQEGEPAQPFRIFTHQYAANPIQSHHSSLLQASPSVTQPAVMSQVKPILVQHFQLAQQNGVSEATIWLVPKSLGRIQIHVVANQGNITAQIVTQTQAAKEALDSQMSQLRQTLLQQGFAVDKLEVIQQPLPQSQNSTPLPQRDSSQGNAQHQFQQDQHRENDDHHEKNSPSFQEWMSQVDGLEESELLFHEKGTIHYQV